MRSLRIGIGGKIRFGCVDREAIAFQVRGATRESLIQQTGLRKSGKVSVSAARNFQLRFSRGDSSQGLNCKAFIGGAHGFWIHAQSCGRISG
ncbi:MAG: hypothetical protein DMF71_17515 [Acidobacteria bacterium]|nr:MAG: hypothetical protein DMF71_17515 [Acidobacteriota bacterium]